MAVPLSQQNLNLALNCLDIPKDAKAAPRVTAENMNKVYTALHSLLYPTEDCPDITEPHVQLRNQINLKTNSWPKAAAPNGLKPLESIKNIQNVTIDAGWGRDTMNRYGLYSEIGKINIFETPGCYIDPATRPCYSSECQLLYDIDQLLDFSTIGLNIIVDYQVLSQQAEVLPLIEFTIKPKEDSNPPPFSIVKIILDRKGHLYKYNKISNNYDKNTDLTETSKVSDDNIYKYIAGNKTKNEFINSSTDAQEINLYVACKVIGDASQALSLKEILRKGVLGMMDDITPPNNKNTSLLSIDMVLFARCINEMVPCLASNNSASSLFYFLPLEKREFVLYSKELAFRQAMFTNLENIMNIIKFINTHTPKSEVISGKRAKNFLRYPMFGKTKFDILTPTLRDFLITYIKIICIAINNLIDECKKNETPATTTTDQELDISLKEWKKITTSHTTLPIIIDNKPSSLLQTSQLFQDNSKIDIWSKVINKNKDQILLNKKNFTKLEEGNMRLGEIIRVLRQPGVESTINSNIIQFSFSGDEEKWKTEKIKLHHIKDCYEEKSNRHLEDIFKYFFKDDSIEKINRYIKLDTIYINTEQQKELYKMAENEFNKNPLSDSARFATKLYTSLCGIPLDPSNQIFYAWFAKDEWETQNLRIEQTMKEYLSKKKNLKQARDSVLKTILNIDIFKQYITSTPPRTVLKFKKTLMAKIVDNFVTQFDTEDIVKFELKNLIDKNFLNQYIQVEFDKKKSDIFRIEKDVEDLSNRLDNEQKEAETLQLDYENKYNTVEEMLQSSIVFPFSEPPCDTPPSRISPQKKTEIKSLWNILNKLLKENIASELTKQILKISKKCKFKDGATSGSDDDGGPGEGDDDPSGGPGKGDDDPSGGPGEGGLGEEDNLEQNNNDVLSIYSILYHHFAANWWLSDHLIDTENKEILKIAIKNIIEYGNLNLSTLRLNVQEIQDSLCNEYIEDTTPQVMLRDPEVLKQEIIDSINKVYIIEAKGWLQGERKKVAVERNEVLGAESAKRQRISAPEVEGEAMEQEVEGEAMEQDPPGAIQQVAEEDVKMDEAKQNRAAMLKFLRKKREMERDNTMNRNDIHADRHAATKATKNKGWGYGNRLSRFIRYMPYGRGGQRDKNKKTKKKKTIKKHKLTLKKVSGKKNKLILKKKPIKKHKLTLKKKTIKKHKLTKRYKEHKKIKNKNYIKTNKTLKKLK